MGEEVVTHTVDLMGREHVSGMMSLTLQIVHAGHFAVFFISLSFH